MWLACQKRNHAHLRRNPPVTQPPQSGNIGVIFLFCHFHNRDIDGIAIFVRLIRSINAIRKREAMASISTTAQAIPQTSSCLSMPISSTVKAVPRSGIRDVFDRALAADDVISLCVGEPGHTAAPYIVEAAMQAARDGKTKYSNINGIPAFREAAADYTRRVKHLDYGSRPSTAAPSVCSWPSAPSWHPAMK